MKHYFKFMIIIFCALISGIVNSQNMLPVGSNADEIVKVIEKEDKDRLETRLPFFVAEELNGKVFTSEKTTKISFYYFWYNCGDPCYTIFPIFNDLQKQFDNKVEFISITYLDKQQLQEIIKEYPLNFKHCVMSQNEIENNRLSIGYPTTLIVVDGLIVYCKSGGAMTSESINKCREDYNAIFEKYLW